jgi:hypothetical protein
MKFKKNIIIILFILIFSPVYIFAIGEFSIGLTTGMNYDLLNLNDTISYYNISMEDYKEANTGTKISKFENPYAPIFGINLKYQFNYLLFRIGSNYSETIFFPTNGMMEIGGVKNKISINRSQYSLPVSFGFLLPFKTRTYYYFAMGMNFDVVYLEIIQTNPSGTVFSNNEKDRFETYFVSFHILNGIEVPLSERYTLTVEWIHKYAKSTPVESMDSSMKYIFNISGETILFGINYYIKF